jgi:DNA-binding Lrp family transcriptional regulator
MNDPIDLKTKKIIPVKAENKFKKSLVLENLELNILTHWDTWGKFQQAWTSRAYNSFKDLDKYIVLIYLIRDNWVTLSGKFQYQSMDEFYETEGVTIDKINLIQISNDLHIPKETIRRKVNELQESNILKRQGKSIIFNRKGIETQKPNDMIELLSIFIEKKSKMLHGKDWFGEPLSKDYIKEFVKKYFTIVWLRFFRMQIPFLIRHRDVFGDLETWIVWGNIALSHQYHLARAAEKNLITSEITLKSYYSNVAEVKISRGINASSIADISRIPRATVIRKLKWLTKQNCIKKNKNLEYQMTKGGKLNKKISENFLLNQHSVAEFLTDIFDLMKNSQFKL